MGKVAQFATPHQRSLIGSSSPKVVTRARFDLEPTVQLISQQLSHRRVWGGHRKLSPLALAKPSLDANDPLGRILAQRMLAPEPTRCDGLHSFDPRYMVSARITSVTTHR